MSEGKVEPWTREEFEQTLKDALVNVQAEAYERGVRDAAKLVKRHSPECWTKFDEAAEEILALLQANPYRGKEPTK